MKLVYNVKEKPPITKWIIASFQQLLAILAATIAVPGIIGNGMSQSAALFGAGVGTMVYLLFTKFKSPVFLGSSFAFIGSMFAAFAGGVSMSVGYMGLIIGAIFAGLVYVVISLIVKKFGVKWISKLMPPVVIGPTVAIIGLSLAVNAVRDAVNYGDGRLGAIFDSANSTFVMNLNGGLSLLCALVTLATIMICSVYGSKNFKLFPFVIGILAGYVLATIFTVIGLIAKVEALVLVDFTKFANMKWYPEFTFIKALDFNSYDFGTTGNFWAYIAAIAVAYIPVAFVVFAEHIADHKNLSTIIDQELLEDPGLHRTLLGDGVGSMAGAFFGGCPNTTYGESVGCVAITGNASVYTIFLTAIIAIAASFFAPFVTFLSTIPPSVMGGVCISLYGFIAVSGLKMIQKVDLNQNNNLFVVSIILITGIGGMSLTFGLIKITAIAVALILGILANLLLNIKCKKQNVEE